MILRIVASLLLLFVFAGCGRTLDADGLKTFQQAQQTFDTAKAPTDYLLAASIFQRLVDQGVQSGVVYYNQGNAYMRGGQRGRAIACYRLAKRYRPRDPQLDANLQFAVGQTARTESRPLLEYVFFWQNQLSYPEKFQISLATAAGTLALALAGLYLNPLLWRRLAAAGLVVTFLLSGSALYDWYRFEHVQHGVVIVPNVMARKGNAGTYEPAFTSPLQEGVEFTVVEPRGEWLLIRLPAGQEGWLKRTDAVIF